MTTPGADQPYADLRETHSGIVLLLGPVAYKLKKPVRLPFLDFSTAGARLAACRREIELNRRISPDVYLGLATLQSPDRSTEPMVTMKRMPEDRRLSHLAATGAVGDSDVRSIARLVAAFHARADRSTEIAEAGRPDVVRRRWRANLDEAEQIADGAISAETLVTVRERSERFLAGRDGLFERRIEAGCIVDGHGDLLADDIFCLEDGPRILDCLEFDDRLRHLDKIDDIACLAMDLERLGRADHAGQLLDWYGRFSGDDAPASLVHHYVAYRAFMRAKVACVRRRQSRSPSGGGGEDPALLADLSMRHLQAGAVRLVLVGGAPGTGKSTLAEALGNRLDAAVINSDRVRKELAGLDPYQPAGASFQEGVYSPDWTARTYAEMLHRARLLLSGGESVILDASWRECDKRDAASELARTTYADLVQLRCELPPPLAAERMLRRHGISDADEHIAAAIRRRAVPWPGSVPIDTTVAPEIAADAAAAAVGTMAAPDQDQEPSPAAPPAVHSVGEPSGRTS